jgi:protease IV
MSKKHRSITTVLAILGIAVLCFGTAMAIVLSLSQRTSLISSGDQIGVIPVQGVIKDPNEIVDQLIAFRKDSHIKAIILKINSPGGGVVPSQEIYSEAKRTSKTKHVVAAFGSLGASGAYYIASAADKIVANPGTLTGSIGVIMEFIRVEELLKKIGVEMEIIKSGEFKDIGSPNREMTESEKILLKNLIEDIRDQFVTAVAQGRNMPRERISELADGRIFSGREAKELGLVDYLGNFQDAVNITKQIAKIKGEAQLIYPEKKRKSLLFDYLLKDVADHIINRIERRSGLEYRWNGGLKFSD